MFERFAHRSQELERLDTGEFTYDEYRRWEREMWYIHRFFGEIRAMRRTLVADIRQRGTRKVSVVDVGAGSGGLLLALESQLPEIVVYSVGIEMYEDAARSIQRASIDAVQADAMKLPFADASFDCALCSLVLHHLEPIAATNLLSEMARIARHGIYVIDLDREPLPYYLYKVFGRFFLQRFTVEDGALSILRAYRPRELAELARSAGLEDILVTRSKLNRLVLTGRKAR